MTQQLQATIESDQALNANRTLGQLLALPSAAAHESQFGAESFAADLAFPLQRVRVRTTIVGDCAVTELQEHYTNTNTIALDVVHTLALPAGGAVTAFEMRAGERTIKGVCKKRGEARETFESARARGKTAALVESVRDDVHTISLTNVLAKSDITVTMTIVERLRVCDGRFEFRFPTTISQKYIPGDPVAHRGSGTSPDTDYAPDASQLTPPIRLAGGTELDLEIALPREVSEVAGSISFTRTDGDDGFARIRPAGRVTCNGDIVLRYWTRGSDAIVRGYTDGQRTLVVVDPPATRRADVESAHEAIFVLDRSGSMNGGRIDAAKRALTKALAALCKRDFFQIIAFNTVLEASAPQPVSATTATRALAMKWLANTDARGGTEAMPALEAACCGAVAKGRVRTVMFITDGAVGNDQEILALTRRFDPATRLFVVGIGVAPTDAFLSRLARLGGGTHVLLANHDDIEAEIGRLNSALSGPMACGLHEEGGRSTDRADLFAGRSATFFIDGARENVRVTSIDGGFTGSCTVARAPIALGALWARDEVMRLEDRLIAQPHDEHLIEAEIETLGLAHQIQTRRTSFVAVDEASQVHEDAIEIVQPVDCAKDVVTQCFYKRGYLREVQVMQPGIHFHRAPRDFRLANFGGTPVPKMHKTVSLDRQRSTVDVEQISSDLRAQLSDPRGLSRKAAPVVPTTMREATMLIIALLAYGVSRRAKHWAPVMKFLRGLATDATSPDAAHAQRMLLKIERASTLKFVALFWLANETDLPPEIVSILRKFRN